MSFNHFYRFVCSSENKMTASFSRFEFCACFIVLFGFSVVTIYNIKSYGSPHLFKFLIEDAAALDNKTVILVWSSYFGRKGQSAMDVIPVVSVPPLDSRCCEVTTNRNLLNVADAVVFHGSDIRPATIPVGKRKSDQVWVFMSKESPILSGSQEWYYLYDGLFNWTMTYRLDSDVNYIYGEKVKLTLKEKQVSREDDLIKEIVRKKKKLVVGAISNCKTSSKRELLIEKMRSYVKIDIYGRCGMKTVPFHNSSPDWWKNLGETYKFYLAFENALCVDYVTEKFWRTLLIGMVPVVYGGANYSLLAPPNSYIDVSSFNSSKELVDYLLFLDKNPKEYKKYFEWRKEFKVTNNEVGFYWLCEMLKEFKGIRGKGKLLEAAGLISKTKNNLKDWWLNGGPNGTSSCQSPLIL